MIKKILFFIIISVFLLAGCKDRECLKSHEETTTCYMYMGQYIGKIYITTPIPYTCTVDVCDEYKENN